ncbi:hypothetical protein jhhlp_002095 [Lomentospora prolificans]|uniref:PHD-type domain-containing protein n=1 Tax=Lomentospora prolificans TaxID=41688 RepID=A0A2N3ND19_9PEZI|nr:hypothetical protein jhhlp_002095 [Lomentospora prolificans]
MTELDQCIICLEPLVILAKPPSVVTATELDTALEVPTDPPDASSILGQNAANSDANSRIAALDGCDHVIHDSCIRLWAQKTNTCPICREPFRQLRVFDGLSGTVLECIEIEEKKQVAEFDPQAWLADNAEEEEEEPEQPCPVCSSSEREDVLLLCDGCDAAYHTYCIGLDYIPSGNWYCMECADDFSHAPREEDDEARRVRRRPRQRRTVGRTPSRFPRTRERMRRARRQARSLAWTGPWGQFAGRVYDALQIDLDNHEDDDALAEFRMSQILREREQREYQRWQQRVSIASRLGAGEVFTNSLPRAARQQLEQRPPVQPVQETRDEMRSWGALERARIAEQSSSGQTGRKRRATSAAPSPAEPVQEPERKLKRPRTRRFLPPQSEASSSKASALATGRPSESGSSSRSAEQEAPSFLSALLKEVEVGVGTPSDDDNVKNYFGRAPTDAASPASSPTVSAHNSPRALSLTPPPLSLGRPNSPPLSLSSYVEPRYPKANYSPMRQTSPRDQDSETRIEKINAQTTQHTQNTQNTENLQTLEIRQPRPRRPQEERAARSIDTSPTRDQLSPEAKASINGIVRTALKPHWHARELTTEQYSNINRDVSRKLYDEIKDPTLLDDESMKTWEKVASKEVARAVAESKA